MNKRWLVLALLAPLALAFVWPDLPAGLLSRVTPDVHPESWGPFWHYQFECSPGRIHPGVDFGQPSKPVRVKGFSSVLFAVNVMDICGQPSGSVSPNASVSVSIGLRPVNGSLPKLGVYRSPWNWVAGVLDASGYIPVLALDAWPDHRAVFFSWYGSSLCRSDNQSECQFDILNWHLRSSEG